MMKKDIKEKIMVASALITLGSGIILSFLSFFLSSYHIDNSVLWYFAQTLMYAGSCFGIGAYITKFRNEVNEKINNTEKP
jgi:O-antigen/teichoic acid export membrane protein